MESCNVSFLHFKTSLHPLQWFQRFLFRCEAPEMFRGLQKLPLTFYQRGGEKITAEFSIFRGTFSFMLRRAKSVLDLELFDEKYIKQHVCYPT